MKYINIDIDGKVNNIEPYFANGTSLKGHTDTPYKKLVEVFGKPNIECDGYKTDAEWIVFTPVGVATIYNYKDGKNYLGKDGLAVKNITNWHIGGKSEDVVKWIKKALGNQPC